MAGRSPGPTATARLRPTAGRCSASTGDWIEGIKKGHLVIAHAFLAKGADAGARDPQGQTALDLAQQRSRDEIVEVLHRAGGLQMKS